MRISEFWAREKGLGVVPFEKNKPIKNKGVRRRQHYQQQLEADDRLIKRALERYHG